MSSNGWKKVKLGEVINFKNGKKKPDKNGDIPIYGGNGILGFTNNFNSENTVIIGRVGAYCGSVYYEPGKCWISDNAISAQPINNNSTKYAYYVLKSLKLNERRIGTGQPLLTQGILNGIDTIYPSAEEQKAIAATLSCLDDKIELNNRINKTLEEIAQAIFKSWFVDFEPFQDGEFEDSELGRIPKGWRVGTIEEIAEICIGGDWGKEKEEPGLKPVICLRGTDLQSLKEVGYSCNAPIRWVKPDSMIKREITDKDILIGGSGLGPIGRSLYCSNSLKDLYDYPVIYSNFCKKIRARDYQTAVYLETFIENLYVQGALKSYMNGTSIPNLDISNFMKRELLIPSDEAILSFADFKQLYFERQFSTENQELSLIRDTLLPKLMSGEIRVPIEEVQ